MPQLPFEDFICCFRKQFLWQTGRGGRRISAYYTNFNQQQHLKNDQWGIMVFIHTGTQYGFTDKQMIRELKISKTLYEVLKDETPSVLNNKYPDKLLHKKVTIKVGLVKNTILNNHFVKPI